MNPSRNQILLAAALSLLLGATAYPQTATNSSSAKPDDVIKLSEFDVTEGVSHGYISSESVTGTRVATKIADLPFPVSVVTNEFMKDFDFLDISKGMSYVAGLNTFDTQGNYNLRGFNGINMLRNGFYSLGLEDIVEIDRVEVIKGPNAAIYGSTTPSGIPNFITKKAQFSNFQDLQFWQGTLDTTKVNLIDNQFLGTIGGVKVANFIGINWQDNHENATFGFMRNRLLDDNIMFKFKDDSTLNLEVQWTKRKEQFGTTNLPFEYNTATKTYSSVERFDLAHFSQGGPDSQQNRERMTYDLEYDKRWSDVWSTRVGGYAYFRHAFNFNNGTSDQFDPSTNTFNRGTPLVDPLNEDGGALQIDTLAEYKTFNGKVKNKSLFTLDYNQNWRYRKQTTFDQNLYPLTLVNPFNPNYTLPPRSAFIIPTRDDKTRWDTRGFLFSQQSTFLDDKLLVFVAARRDLVTYNLDFGNQYNNTGKTVYTVKLPGAVLHFEDAAWSPSTGLNYKLNSNTALYASYSKSFLGNSQSSKLAAETVPIGNERDRGFDYGVKSNYFDGHLTMTAGGYYIFRTDVSTSVTDPFTGQKETVAAGNLISKGVEFESSWNFNENLVMLASYAYGNSKYITDGGTTTDIGQPPVGIPQSQASFATKYTFTRGPLKGFGLTAGTIYLGKAYPNSTATNIQRNIDSPGYATVQAGLSYTFRAGGNTTQMLRFSGTNILDRKYVTAKMNVGDPRMLYFSYELTH
jgi:iron complex outermembrane receptor protein